MSSSTYHITHECIIATVTIDIKFGEILNAKIKQDNLFLVIFDSESPKGWPTGRKWGRDRCSICDRLKSNHGIHLLSQGIMIL